MSDSEGKGAKRTSDPRKARKSLEQANDTGSTLDATVGPASVAYQLMVDSVRDYAIFMLDPNGYVISWNKGAQMIKGYLPHEIIGKHFSNFYPESERKTKPVIELKYARLEGRFEDEGWRLKKDGSRFWANVVLTAVRNADGDVLGFVKVTRDLTERKANEQKAIA
ncbi:MAG TPA: PAS domain S-box protein, partial [Gemmatimonadaceae bacterium]|nr:PAS domain S-box protein [Gemmatimonadaceae bacterium]